MKGIQKQNLVEFHCPKQKNVWREEGNLKIRFPTYECFLTQQRGLLLAREPTLAHVRAVRVWVSEWYFNPTIWQRDFLQATVVRGLLCWAEMRGVMCGCVGCNVQYGVLSIFTGTQHRLRQVLVINTLKEARTVSDSTYIKNMPVCPGSNEVFNLECAWKQWLCTHRGDRFKFCCSLNVMVGCHLVERAVVLERQT